MAPIVFLGGFHISKPLGTVEELFSQIMEKRMKRVSKKSTRTAVHSA